MPAWLVPAIAAVAGAAGSFFGQKEADKTNTRLTREQMEFQERMSSTAAQRSVEDYRKAGLNVGLAYDRSASSPGGAAAVVGNKGDAINRGISSALAAKQMLQAMEQQKRLTDAEVSLKKAQEWQAKAAGDQSHQGTQFAFALQPYMVRQASADAALKEYLKPGAKNTAELETLMGKIIPGGTSSASAVAKILSMYFSRNITGVPR